MSGTIPKKNEIEQMEIEFISHLYHELLSPLGSIKGFASTMLADKQMDEETRIEFLNIINDESERLALLIENLLDLSKIEYGHIKMDKQKVQILDIVQEAVSNLRPAYEEKKIALKTEAPQDIPLIFCDRDMILKLMTNILLNALKFTPERGRVKVSVKKEKGGIKVKVIDTGIGIQKKNLPFIFDKFYRAERPTDKIRGTGLGLSIAKEIIKSHGGDIWAESRPGKGSTFYFRLPLK
jgi:signal transduction histidine kinase